MHIEFIPEKSQLNSLVVGYSILEVSDLSDFNSNGVTVPDGFIELFFPRYDPISIKMNSQNNSVSADSGFILGQTAKKIEFRPTGKLELLSLKIQPWATSLFFPDKAELFRDKMSLLDDLGVNTLNELQDKILHSHTKEEALEIIRNYLFRLMNKKVSFSSLIFKSINYIFQNYKDFKVKKLSERLNISTQYLERQFLEHIGISPKQFARVIRIRSLTEYYKNNPSISLTDLSYKFGFFDQSHLIRDFKLVVNASPKKFLNSKNMVSSNLHNSI